MKYFKYLNDDIQELTSQLRKYVLNRPDIYNRRNYNWRTVNHDELHSSVPQIKEFLKKYDCGYRHGAFFVTWDQTSGTIHHDDYPTETRFIVPVLNCENTETMFYKSSAAAIPKHNGLVPLFLYNEDQCVPVDSYFLTKAVILRIHQPHKVILHQAIYPRISFTFAADKDMTHLLEDD